MRYLVLSHLHVENDVVDDLVDGALDSTAKPGNVNQGMDKFKHTVNQTLKTKYFTCKGKKNKLSDCQYIRLIFITESCLCSDYTLKY